MACDWHHDLVDEPIEILVEVDLDGFEIRKVERFRDGTFGMAGSTIEAGGSFRSHSAIPSLDEINADEQFRARAISAVEFEDAWQSAARALKSPWRPHGRESLGE